MAMKDDDSRPARQKTGGLSDGGPLSHFLAKSIFVLWRKTGSPGEAFCLA